MRRVFRVREQDGLPDIGHLSLLDFAGSVAAGFGIYLVQHP